MLSTVLEAVLGSAYLSGPTIHGRPAIHRLSWCIRLRLSKRLIHGRPGGGPMGARLPVHLMFTGPVQISNSDQL